MFPISRYLPYLSQALFVAKIALIGWQEPLSKGRATPHRNVAAGRLSDRMGYRGRWLRGLIREVIIPRLGGLRIRRPNPRSGSRMRDFIMSRPRRGATVPEVKLIVRVILVAIAFVAVAKMWTDARDAYRASAGIPPPSRLLDDSVKESLPIRLDASRNLFQVGLLIAGGLWALYIGKSEETKVDLSQTPEVLLFLLCNCSFLVSFASHYVYTDRLSDWINSGIPQGDAIEIPDIDSASLVNLLDFQKWFFQLGCALALATFLGGRYLRADRNEGEKVCRCVCPDRLGDLPDGGAAGSGGGA
jgi:hypothetical protein